MMQLFEKINIQQTLVIIALGIALCQAIQSGDTSLSTALGSGLVGYLGGVGTSTTNNTNMGTSNEANGKKTE